MKHRLSAVIAALGLASMALLQSMTMPSIAFGHCPGTAPNASWRAYGAGTMAVSPNATGVQGYIEFTNPNPCSNQFGNGLTVEAVTLMQTAAINGHVQVGWVKRQGMTAPKMLCEFSGEDGTDYFDPVEFSLPSWSTFKYTFQHDAGNREWECLLNSTVYAVRPSAWLGFQSGSSLNAQGEVNSTHAQIGKMAPDKLDLTALKFKRSGSWTTMNLTLLGTVAPYGRDEPQAGQLRNWTNAH